MRRELRGREILRRSALGVSVFVALLGITACAANDEPSDAGPASSASPVEATSSQPAPAPVPTTAGVPFGATIDPAATDGVVAGAFPMGADRVAFVSGAATGGPPSISVWDATGTQVGAASFGDVDLSCGLASVRVGGDGARGIAALQFTTTPANGTIAATYTVSVITIDEDLTIADTNVLAADVEGEPSCVSVEWDEQGELPNSFDEDGWTLVAAAADGTWVGVGRGHHDNMERASLVGLASGEVVPVAGVAQQIVGNALHHDCSPGDSVVHAVTCAATLDDAVGAPLWKSENFRSVYAAPGYCGASDGNCNYVRTGNPSGVVLVARPVRHGDVFEQALLLADPLSGERVATVEGVTGAGSAAYDPVSRTYAAGAYDSDADTNVLIGIDESGAQRWRLGGTDVCGRTLEGFIVTANDQLALVNTEGVQLAATDGISRCPLVGVNGIGFDVGSGSVVSLQSGG